MRFNLIIAGAIALIATTASADTGVRSGQILRDINALRIGPVDKVNADGSVQVIFESRFVTIPASDVSVVQGNVISTLSRKEISKLR